MTNRLIDKAFHKNLMYYIITKGVFSGNDFKSCWRERITECSEEDFGKSFYEFVDF